MIDRMKERRDNKIVRVYAVHLVKKVRRMINSGKISNGSYEYDSMVSTLESMERKLADSLEATFGK